jgi:hypothetical protein
VRKRILVLGAGSEASNNLIRSLRAGDRDLVIIGGQADRFVLKKSLADRTYLIAAREASDFAASVQRVVDAEAIDLVVPNSDADVRAVSAHRFRSGTRVFLPSADVIELCQDKYALTTFLHSHGVPTPETHPIPDIERVEAVFAQLMPRRRLWCRMRSGSGSMGALPVTMPDQARSWIAYWEQMRGIAPGLFTLSEYLPGRDFNVQGVWKDRAGADGVRACCARRRGDRGGGARRAGVRRGQRLGVTSSSQRRDCGCPQCLVALVSYASDDPDRGSVGRVEGNPVVVTPSVAGTRLRAGHVAPTPQVRPPSCHQLTRGRGPDGRPSPIVERWMSVERRAARDDGEGARRIDHEGGKRVERPLHGKFVLTDHGP